MSNIDLKQNSPSTLLGVKKVYFIGIGGIGMSAIARMLKLEAKVVSGSDRARSLVTDELEKFGVTVFYEQKAENITSDIDLVIYTIAMPADAPELVKARELGIVCKTYPEMLGIISADKFTVAIAGTHGKTTTTAMIAEIMIEAGLDPTVIVGSLLKSGTNFIAGRSNYLVVEACEYRRSFLNLQPQLSIVTNIDNDHLDYYKDLDDIKNAFDQFLSQSENKITDYQKYLTQVPALLVPGEHNRQNAAAALAVADFLKIDPSTAIKALEKFTGTWRRFEYKGETKNGTLIYDDYAHHPTEIAASIQAAREFMTKRRLAGKLIIAFQPHLYSRTKLLRDDFVVALSKADKIFLAPIYAAREGNDPTINSEILAELIKVKNPQVFPVSDLKELTKRLKEEGEKGDLIITVGAGTISELGDKLIEKKV